MERLDGATANGFSKLDKSASKFTRIAAGLFLSVTALACEQNTQEATPTEISLVNIHTLDCSAEEFREQIEVDSEGFLTDRFSVQFDSESVPQSVISILEKHNACVIPRVPSGIAVDIEFLVPDQQVRDDLIDDLKSENSPAVKLVEKNPLYEAR